MLLQNSKGDWSMDIKLLKEIIAMGDKHGSAFKELCKEYNIKGYDISQITDEMAKEFIERKIGNE